MQKHSTPLLPIALVALLTVGASPALAGKLAPPSESFVRKIAPNVELRDQAPQVQAVVQVRGPWDDGQREAHKRLTHYVNGFNQPQQADARNAAGQIIPLTAPMLQHTTPGVQTMAVVMPGGSRLREVPIPRDTAISLKAVPAQRIAVLSYGGWASPENVAERGAELRRSLMQAGLKPVGPLMLAQRSNPSQWLFRRNELMVAVR